MTDRRIFLEEGHQRLIRARHGYLLYNRNDAVVSRLLESYGEYMESEVDVFRRFVSAGDVVLDVGANIGMHTLALARLVGPRGFLFSFEPQRLAFQTLCANVALNSLDNVHCVNAAVAESRARLSVSDPDPNVPGNFGGISLDQLTRSRSAAPVEQVALDDYLTVGQLKLIKIDVETMEAAVLRGARATLDRFKPVLYVENGYVTESPGLVSLLRECGYRCYWHLATYWAADNFFGNEERLYPVAFVDRGTEHLDAVGFAVNMLCVHGSFDVPIQGLREIADPLEHPFRRSYTHLFSGEGAAGIPLINEP